MRRFPCPPLLFAAPFAAGYLVHRLWPHSILPQTSALHIWVGAGLVAAGLLLQAWALGVLMRSRTSPAPWRPSTALVTSGPYRLSRNPVYVADAVIYVGGAIWVNSVAVLLFLPAAIVLAQRLAVRPEEEYLAGVFGSTYDAYRTRVRRWL